MRINWTAFWVWNNSVPDLEVEFTLVFAQVTRASEFLFQNSKVGSAQSSSDIVGKKSLRKIFINTNFCWHKRYFIYDRSNSFWKKMLKILSQYRCCGNLYHHGFLFPHGVIQIDFGQPAESLKLISHSAFVITTRTIKGDVMKQTNIVCVIAFFRKCHYKTLTWRKYKGIISCKEYLVSYWSAAGKYNDKTLKSLLAIIGKQVWMGCKCESLNVLLQIDFNWCMMMTGPLLAWIQKLPVQHFTLEI